jgi:hypothetical protein
MMWRWIDDARVWNHSRWNTFHDRGWKLSNCLTAKLSNFYKQEMAMMLQSTLEISGLVLSHIDQVAHLSAVEEADRVFRLRIVEDQSNSRVRMYIY